MGRDRLSIVLPKGSNISTHTPAWGVTGVYHDDIRPHIISTHTPAWGVTYSPEFPRRTLLNFNSHARVGRDKIVLDWYEDYKISTHTPAWGVTRWRDRRFTVAFNFNSHARVGRDSTATPPDI